MRIKMISLQDLHQAIGGRITVPAAMGEPSTIQLGPLAIDSRDVSPGDVFWALPGKHCDGGEFLDEAFARGAAGAVISHERPCPPDRWLIQVDDTVQALDRWAEARRRQFPATVIAVAGSVGKTTTRQMIHTVLGRRLRSAAAPKNASHETRVALSLAALGPEDEYAVIELHANTADEMARLAELCRPTIGVIPHVAETAAGVPPKAATAHAELLASLRQDGWAVLADNPWLRRAASRCRAAITWVGRSGACDLAATDIEWHPGRLTFRLDGCRFRVPVWGRHHLNSALIAIAVGRLLGFTLEETAAALENFDPLPTACEVSEIRGATIIHDGHNASAPAMRAALELLRDFDTTGRRIVVLGDVAAAEDEAVLLHRQLGNQVVTLCGADVLIACGDCARDVVAAARAAGMPSRQAIACRTPEEAPAYLGQILLPGDVVVIKGVRVLSMQHVVDALKHYPKRRSA